MDWATNLQIFTPISIAMLAAYLVVLAFLVLWAWSARAAIKVWFLLRLSESNSQDAINTALTTSALCLIGAAPVSTVAPLWAACIGIFLKPEAKANPTPAGPA